MAIIYTCVRAGHSTDEFDFEIKPVELRILINVFFVPIIGLISFLKYTSYIHYNGKYLKKYSALILISRHLLLSL